MCSNEAKKVYPGFRRVVPNSQQINGFTQFGRRDFLFYAVSRFKADGEMLSKLRLDPALSGTRPRTALMVVRFLPKFRRAWNEFLFFYVQMLMRKIIRLVSASCAKQFSAAWVEDLLLISPQAECAGGRQLKKNTPGCDVWGLSKGSSVQGGEGQTGARDGCGAPDGDRPRRGARPARASSAASPRSSSAFWHAQAPRGSCP